MNRYGHDYDQRNWMERAGERVQGWFGGGERYDREYNSRYGRGDQSRTSLGRYDSVRAYPNPHSGQQPHPRGAGWSGRGYSGGYTGGRYDQAYRRGYDSQFGGPRNDRYDRDFQSTGRGEYPYPERRPRGSAGGYPDPARGGMLGGYTAGGGLGAGGIDRFRGGSAGGVVPGRYFTGYGHGGPYRPGW